MNDNFQSYTVILKKLEKKFEKFLGKDEIDKKLKVLEDNLVIMYKKMETDISEIINQDLSNIKGEI